MAEPKGSNIASETNQSRLRFVSAETNRAICSEPKLFFFGFVFFVPNPQLFFCLLFFVPNPQLATSLKLMFTTLELQAKRCFLRGAPVSQLCCAARFATPLVLVFGGFGLRNANGSNASPPPGFAVPLRHVRQITWEGADSLVSTKRWRCQGRPKWVPSEAHTVARDEHKIDLSNPQQ